MVLISKLHCKQRQCVSMPYDTAVEMSASQANSTSEEKTSVGLKLAGVYELAPKGKVRSNTTETLQYRL